jgi:ubiquinone biosynthesis protein COQ9
MSMRETRASAACMLVAMSDEPDWADEAEERLLTAALDLAPALGWSRRLVGQAAKATGLSQPEADLLLPYGPRDLAALLSRRHDRAAMATLSTLDPLSLKVRERIRRGVLARCDAAAADEPAVRRWSGFLALPMNVPLALRLVWESADVIWRWAGDTATDENHYSKRAILSTILITTLGVRMQEGAEAEAGHLSAAIDKVMAFEKWKAKFHPAEQAKEIARALGRIRYGRE